MFFAAPVVFFIFPSLNLFINLSPPRTDLHTVLFSICYSDGVQLMAWSCLKAQAFYVNVCSLLASIATISDVDKRNYGSLSILFSSCFLFTDTIFFMFMNRQYLNPNAPMCLCNESQWLPKKQTFFFPSQCVGAFYLLTQSLCVSHSVSIKMSQNGARVGNQNCFVTIYSPISPKKYIYCRLCVVLLQ